MTLVKLIRNVCLGVGGGLLGLGVVAAASIKKADNDYYEEEIASETDNAEITADAEEKPDNEEGETKD